MIEPKADLAIPLCNPYSPFPPDPASLRAAQRPAGSATDGKSTARPGGCALLAGRKTDWETE